MQGLYTRARVQYTHLASLQTQHDSGAAGIGGNSIETGLV